MFDINEMLTNGMSAKDETGWQSVITPAVVIGLEDGTYHQVHMPLPQGMPEFLVSMMIPKIIADTVTQFRIAMGPVAQAGFAIEGVMGHAPDCDCDDADDAPVMHAIIGAMVRKDGTWETGEVMGDPTAQEWGEIKVKTSETDEVDPEDGALLMLRMSVADIDPQTGVKDETIEQTISALHEISKDNPEAVFGDKIQAINPDGRDVPFSDHVPTVVPDEIINPNGDVVQLSDYLDDEQEQ